MSLRTRLSLALAGSGLAILLAGAVGREIAVRYASEALIQSSLESRVASLDREACESGRDFERREFRRRPEEGPGFGGPHEGGPPPMFGPGGPQEGGPGPRPGGPGGLGFGREGPGPRPGEPPRERDGLPRFERGVPRMPRVFFYDGEFRPRPPGGPPVPEAARHGLKEGRSFIHGRDEGGFFGAIPTAWPGGSCAYAVAFLPTPPTFASVSSLIAGGFALIVAPAVVLWFALTKPVARLRSLASDVRATAAAKYETSISVTGDDEIAELGRAFNDASAVVRAHVANVERREKALRDFVAHTTHDVALPLSVLLSHVSRLRETGSGAPGAQEAIAAIAQETQYIASLLANLDAVSRLESDPSLHEKNPVDLTALVERVAVRHRGVAASSGVDFNHSAPQTPVVVEGDLTLIEQAVNNLVHNAIQYNRSGGHVALVLDTTGGGFELRVIDDGPGVPQADLERLGENRFRSDEARSRRPNGMGLGLSIVRDVAKRHGFEIRFSNREEGGFEALLSGRAEPVARP